MCISCMNLHKLVWYEGEVGGWVREMESYDYRMGPPPYWRMGGGDDRMHETRLLSFKS